jgi:CheY-like chemotaxis protein
MVNRKVATSMLSRYGASVNAVDSGMAAVAAVKNQGGNNIDLILMDIQMPEVTSSFTLFFWQKMKTKALL